MSPDLTFTPKRGKVSTLPAFSVSVVTYHVDIDELRNCLQCLMPARPAEVIVVDNGSNPETRDCLSREFPSVRYLPSENIGYGRAHNFAYESRKVKAPLHLVINTDIEFEPDVITELREVMALNPQVSLLHPMMLNPDGTRQETVRRLPTPLDLILRRFLPKKWGQKRRRRYLLSDLDCSQAYRLPYFQGSFMLFRSEEFERIGKFDSRFFMYPEDIDITRRLFTTSATLYYPFVSVTHNHRQSSYKSRQMLWIHMINMMRYFNKWGWFFDRERCIINRSIDRLV